MRAAAADQAALQCRPRAGFITLEAKGALDDTNIACKVETGRALAIAGCSGDVLRNAIPFTSYIPCLQNSCFGTNSH